MSRKSKPEMKDAETLMCEQAHGKTNETLDYDSLVELAKSYASANPQ